MYFSMLLIVSIERFYVVLCYVMLCYVMLSYVMLCYVGYVMLLYVIWLELRLRLYGENLPRIEGISCSKA